MKMLNTHFLDYYTYTYISIKISKRLLLAEDVTRTVFPQALVGLFMYEAVKNEVKRNAVV